MINLKKISTYIFLLFIMCTVILSGCDSKLRRYQEKGVTDKSIQQLDVDVNTIKEGLPFAIERVNEWQEGLEIDFINFRYPIEDKKISEEGVISYFFYGENLIGDICADARVDIDTKTNCIINFNGGYGTAKQLLGSPGALDVDSWNIDIKDALEIFKREIDESRIANHEKPNLIIRCYEKQWEVAQLTNREMAYDDYCVEINPETGETLNIRGERFDILDTKSN